jgi:S-DNA-T family DNA segregation ATPase FtsK/SpoIIIE
MQVLFLTSTASNGHLCAPGVVHNSWLICALVYTDRDRLRDMAVSQEKSTKNNSNKERGHESESSRETDRQRSKKNNVRSRTRGSGMKDSAVTRRPAIESRTLKSIGGVLCLAVAGFFALAYFSMAGAFGSSLYGGLSYLFGTGYILIPLSFVFWAVALFNASERSFSRVRIFGLILFFISALALVNTASVGAGGVVGSLLSVPLVGAIDVVATVLILTSLIVVALLLIFDTHLRIPQWFVRTNSREIEEIDVPLLASEAEELITEMPEPTHPETESEAPESIAEAPKKKGIVEKIMGSSDEQFTMPPASGKVYVPPPLSILEKNKGKPSVGDVKSNANIIKRTLQNFGIDVEMDEVSIGPSVTRYALKPAEGVRLSRIVSLQNNLELALAASPVRIEAPIPGKALVGVEVPNQSRAMLGMGTILASEEFKDPKKPLLVALGSDISGISHYANLAKMPHVLIAGATGSGKSATIHDLIVSLLYRSGPDQLRFIMIDPKRVELTMYNEIPHLMTPVITDPKKAILSLKWLTKEMDRRYTVLESESVRDIGSYHTNILMPALKDSVQNPPKETFAEDGTPLAHQPSLPEPMPYIVAIIDELADLMQTYPRELEASIVRLAQMSRAVGIHLVLSTQRPSVKVITGLIKANIPARIALQVASQIDSRTILDMGGAENLLGAGDMLYLSGEMSKPVRIQAPYISETELKNIVKFLKDEYRGVIQTDTMLMPMDSPESGIPESALMGGFGGDTGESDDDLYDDARAAVLEAGKASTSYLQRKLRIGYSRAARLMDILEERGVIGSADGSKPREILGSTNSPSENADDTAEER